MGTLHWPAQRFARFELAVTLVIALTTSIPASAAYDVSQVDGMNLFRGSVEAEKLLATNGFVVAAPAYFQIFDPYFESDPPVFVTPDSAWHTYHMILEEGVKEMERVQSSRLLEFSRLLLEEARKQAANGISEFTAIADYAAIGLAFQDRTFRDSLAESQQKLISALTDGSSPVSVSIGFILSPVQFRPQSFYVELPELQDFYRARQWYACVDFRLANERETFLALCLAWLVQGNTELLKLWKQLSEPYDAFVASAEDGTVDSYSRVANTTLTSPNFNPPSIQRQLSELRKNLATALRSPGINDQMLSTPLYLRFPQETKGFRLLPARQVPCGVCFQNTVDPSIPGRTTPSGLDFFVASAVLRSAASERALRLQAGDAVLNALRRAECPPMPDSLYGQSLELLAKLQARLPSSVAEPFRSDAWADLQLGTQLAAWSEQRHTWALYSKLGGGTAGGHTPPPGVVAPYPDFFSGLAKLATQTALAFENTIGKDPFDARALAADLYAFEKLIQSNYSGMSEEDMQRLRPRSEHFGRFIDRFYAAHTAEMNTNARVLHADLDAKLKRVMDTEQANSDETEILKMYYDTRLKSPPLLRKLADVCNRLADLARKCQAGEDPNHDDARWVRNYGPTIAGLQGYSADTFSEDFPIISRIYHDQYTHSILYAGVARPLTLYVILPYKGTLQLYRGAVLSYREFSHPEDQSLDDQSWRETVSAGKTPAPPAFTSSFLRPDPPAPNQKRPSKILKGLKPGEPGKFELAVKEIPLGAIPKEWSWGDGISMSDDCAHVAYRTHRGKPRIFRDGGPGKEYDEAEYQGFSPDSQHLAYVANANGTSFIVLDGKEAPPCSRILQTIGGPRPFVFSSDSQHLAYACRVESGKECVFVDDAQGPLFDEISPYSFSFSANSKHSVYAGRRGNRTIIIKDSKQMLETEDILSPSPYGGACGPFLNADGSRVAIRIQKNGKSVMVVDGIESQPWDTISDMRLDGQAAAFSPDGRHFTYCGMREDKYSVVVDHKEYPGAWMYYATFSPDSKHMAFISATNNSQYGISSRVVLDGVPGKTFDGAIQDLVFSPDSKTLAYKVNEGIATVYTVVHGGQEFDDYRESGDIVFSPDSRHMAFLADKQGQSFCIVDGREYLKSDDFMKGNPFSHHVTFSPDSKRWAYTAEHDGGVYAVISGNEYGPYESIGAEDGQAYICFSPDSQHFAFMAARDKNGKGIFGHQFLVVDGHEYELQGGWWLFGSVLRFDSPTKLHGLVMGTDHFARLQAEVRQKSN